MAEWTREPGRGAYWFQLAGAEPDIVWVFNGMVWDIVAVTRTLVRDDVAAGGMFYGPLDPPPPMPDRSSESVRK